MIQEERLLVFISSAIEELREERKAVREAIEALPLVRPWLFEETPPAPELEGSFLQKVRECHFFVLLIGEHISDPVRKEYATATEAHKPCFVFLKEVARDARASEFVDSLRVKWSRFENLADLRDKVQAAICDYLIRSFREYQLSQEEVSKLGHHLEKIEIAVNKSVVFGDIVGRDKVTIIYGLSGRNSDGSIKITFLWSDTCLESRFGAQFAVDRSTSVAHMQEWMRGYPFAPRNLAQRAEVVELKGLFLPYWVFRYEARTSWRATDSQYDYEFGDTHIGEQSIEGELMVFAGEADDLGGEFSPQPTEWGSGSRPKRPICFAIDALSRHKYRRLFPLDELKDKIQVSWCVQQKVSKDYACQLVKQRIQQDCYQQVADRFHRVLYSETKIDSIRGIFVYLPVWLITYRYQQDVYRVVIDGITGDTIIGEVPVDWLQQVFHVLGVKASSTCRRIISSCMFWLLVSCVLLSLLAYYLYRLLR